MQASILLAFALILWAGEGTAGDSKIFLSDTFPDIGFGYPVPDDKRLVFFIQRSMNANTLVYVAKHGPDGTLDPKSPLEVYWRRFATNGAKKTLTFLERILAYGVHVERRSSDPPAFSVNITSYPERKSILREDISGAPVLTLVMEQYEVKLICAYVTLKGRGDIRKVVQIDIVGKDLASGQYVVETVIP